MNNAVALAAATMPYSSATIYLDHDYNIITGQVSECMECRQHWAGLPLEFVFDDPSAGWYQDDMAPYVAGYCKPCARKIANAHHQDIISGAWYERDMEDERAMG